MRDLGSHAFLWRRSDFGAQYIADLLSSTGSEDNGAPITTSTVEAPSTTTTPATLQLQHLDVSDNFIGFVGARMLSQALLGNQSLKSFRLAGNPIEQGLHCEEDRERVLLTLLWRAGFQNVAEFANRLATLDLRHIDAPDSEWMAIDAALKRRKKELEELTILF